mmetsp:Transcript_20676/g.51718  ORF Transcript_20676/g.51718 Transcript_20676/m.51718 type:complete len:124 (+) Transcript_20676:821-1192(+)
MQHLCPSLVRWRVEDLLPQSKMLWKAMPPKKSVIAFFKSSCHVQGEAHIVVQSLLPRQWDFSIDSLVTRAGLSIYNPESTASWVHCEHTFCDGLFALPPPQEPERMPQNGADCATMESLHRWS